MKHLNCKLYYQQLHLKYWCNLARYWLQAVWGWHDSVETCSSVIVCEIIVYLLVTVQNNKTYVKHLNCKLYYQQLHLKYWCNLTRYWLQAVWGWHDSVETCSSVIICEIIVYLLVTVHSNKNSAHSWFSLMCVFLNISLLSNISDSFPPNRKAGTNTHQSSGFTYMHKLVVFSDWNFANTQFKKEKKKTKRKTTVEKECGEVRKGGGSFTNGSNLAKPSRHYVKRAVLPPPLSAGF